MTTDLRVLHVVTRLNIGGPANEIAALCRHAAANGIQAMVASGRADHVEGDRFDTLDLGGAERERLPGLARTPGVVREVRTLAALRRLIRRWQPDVVHTHTSKAGLWGRLAVGTRAPRPVVCHTYHGTVFRGYFGRRTTAAIVRLERWLGARTDGIIVLGQAGAAELGRLGIGRCVEVIPPGFDPGALTKIASVDRSGAREALGVSGEEPVMAAVGRLAPIKAIDVLLEAMALLDTRPTLLLAGDGPERARLVRLARRLDLESRVRFLGWVDDVAPVLRAADLVVAPSKNEGFPHGLIEAMAAGRPIVSTDVGEIASFVPTEACELVPVGSRVALARAIDRLLRDPDRMARARAAAIRGVPSLLTADESATRTAALYRRLLRERDVVRG